MARKFPEFDVDLDDMKQGLIGGEMTDRWNVGPCWDWKPDEGDVSPAKSDSRVIGQLSHSECTALRGRA